MKSQFSRALVCLVSDVIVVRMQIIFYTLVLIFSQFYGDILLSFILLILVLIFILLSYFVEMISSNGLFFVVWVYCWGILYSYWPTVVEGGLTAPFHWFLPGGGVVPHLVMRSSISVILQIRN